MEIDKAKDLSAIKEFVSQLGLTYKVDEQEELDYTNEVKLTLDNRYQEFKDGHAKMIGAKESMKRVKHLISAKK